MTDRPRPATWDRRDFWLAALIFTSCLGGLLILFQEVVKGWFPNNDDIPVILNSALLLPGQSWTDWFIRGFRDYFQFMPDWQPQDEILFYRPATNFFYFLLWKLFGDDWPLWETATLACHAAGGAATYVVGRRGFGLPRPRAAAAAGLMAISAPAFSGSQLTMAAFSHEFLLAPLAAATFFLVRNGRIVAAAVTLLLVLMVKETGLWMIPAALLSAVLCAERKDERIKRWRDALLLGLPALIWILYRATVTRLAGPDATAVVEYLESLDHPITVLKVITQHFLTWPSAYYIPSYANLLSLSPALESGLKTAAIALDLLWWAILLDLGWAKLWKARPVQRDPAILWALTGAAFLVVAPTGEPRYGYSEMVFFLPAILSNRHWRLLASAGLVYCAAILWLLDRQGHAAWVYDTAEAMGPKFDRALGEAIRSAGPDVKEIYYVGDELSAHLMPTLLDRNLPLYELGWYNQTCAGNPQFSLDRHRTGAELDMTLRVSDCVIILLGMHSPGGPYDHSVIRRSDRISYEITMSRSTADLFAGPAPSWLERHSFLVNPRWPVPDGQMPNMFRIRVALRTKARFIIENPADHSLLVWDEEEVG